MSRQPKDEPLSRKEERNLLDMFRETFEERHPNPDRIGCPGTGKIATLAFRKSFPEAEPVVTHLTQCSPCFREYSRRVRQRKLRRLLIPLAAAAVLVLGCAFWLFRERMSRGPSPDNPPIVKTPEPVSPTPESPAVPEPKRQEFQVVTLDLRKRGISRGENSSHEGDLDLPKGRLKLSIYLPIGSEVGEYEVRISGRQNQVVTAKAQATMKDHVNILTVGVDTSAFGAGKYSLAIRQTGWGWNRYPLQLKEDSKALPPAR